MTLMQSCELTLIHFCDLYERINEYLSLMRPCVITHTHVFMTDERQDVLPRLLHPIYVTHVTNIYATPASCHTHTHMCTYVTHVSEEGLTCVTTHTHVARERERARTCSRAGVTDRAVEAALHAGD